MGKVKYAGKKAARFALAVGLSVLFVVTAVQAATTISTNIVTGGTLTVTGAGHFTDDINVNGGDINLGTGSATTTVTSSGGYLGIGATHPLQALQVVGSGIFTGDVDIYGGDINLGTGSATTTLTSASGKLGIASTTPGATFSINNSSSNVGVYIAAYPSGSADLVRVSTSTATATTTVFQISNTGKVGVATTTVTDIAAIGVSGGSAIFASTATTSVVIDATAAGIAGCIQLRTGDTNKPWVRIYATTTPTSAYTNNGTGMGYQNLVVEAGVCR